MVLPTMMHPWTVAVESSNVWFHRGRSRYVSGRLGPCLDTDSPGARVANNGLKHSLCLSPKRGVLYVMIISFRDQRRS